MNGVAAVNAATDNDGIDNTKFQSSTEEPPSTAPLVISKKVVRNCIETKLGMQEFDLRFRWHSR